MIEVLKGQVHALSPKVPTCQVCDLKMVKHPKKSADGDDDWLRLTEFWYCTECCDLDSLLDLIDEMESPL